ncbi:hypothetical protein PRH55_000129 [Morganella morganii]|uniref:hypothetical protein n=1 Tax=Morganella morganii TaxID=582 RepID=UPI0009206D27|nr:hypothetical protein [Morganella morganii]SGE29064.1 Uncharacterised protein [Mycobacterium tuberculosis]EKL3976801.1 hypothetical protein [Morganella morganii]ELB1013071.1 hypothetical protein [Morganella morganii]MBA5838307.1 hypothetical protein [Morganella morganii]MBT0415681.1 hypothetical protein [Morganella morganii subsp. morganii]
MLTEHIEQKFKNDMFEFVYAYARFEYCIKKNVEYSDEKKVEGKAVQPNWDGLVSLNKRSLTIDNIPSGKILIDLKPKKQVFSREGWKEIVDTGNYLNNVVFALKAVRNNLFHGGKECESGFESSDRNMDLIRTGTKVINEMVVALRWDNDFSARH